jgi:hypothetical protein
MNLPGVITVSVRGAHDRAPGISDAVITAAGGKRAVEDVVEQALPKCSSVA